MFGSALKCLLFSPLCLPHFVISIGGSAPVCCPSKKKDLKSGANRWQTAALGGHLLIMCAWSALLFKVKSECWLATTTSSLLKSFVWRRLFRSFLSPAKNSQWENTFVAINRPLAGNSCSCWSRAVLYPLQTSFICWLFIYFIFFFCISFGARVKKIRPLSSVRTSNASRHSIPVELQRMGTWFLSATSDQLTVSCLRDLNRCGRRCSSNLYSKVFTNLLCV